MKLKSRPEDFVVEEISSFTPDPAGRFFVYELTKRSLATFEALRVIAREAGMHARDLSAAGLKDKHGLTRQLISSPRVLPGKLKDDRLELRLVGKATAVMTAGSIVGNRFEITMRNLREADLEVLPRNAAEIRQFGLPNYYDNQRFGGIAHGRGFIGRALAVGDFEQALRLHLAAPHRKQSLTDKNNRRLADELWGDWDTLHHRMKRSPERALVDYLRKNPRDWAGCFDRITPSLRVLFVAAYQSWLFNETVRRMIKAAVPVQHMKYRAGELAFYRELPPEVLARWRDMEVPQLGPGTRLEDFPEAAPHVVEVLKSEGISQEQLAVEGLERTGFKASARKALMWPGNFEMDDPVDDELNEGAKAVTLRFDLGRGMFGTMVTRRLGLRVY
ncbi:MAG: tRNA pseudouridine(13) synthase TruD [Planctomycetes bacterium]|nr:tRNA pseudouridine(13) synthase TruD [Planctomycetota bacterium]